MKAIKIAFSLFLALTLVFSFGVAAMAEGTEDEAAVEEVFDAVAEQEAAEAAEEAAAEAEAEKVNDVLELDAEREETTEEEGASQDAAGSSHRLSGPMLSLLVGAILIALGGVVIIASNKKIKAGKRGKS